MMTAKCNNNDHHVEALRDNAVPRKSDEWRIILRKGNSSLKSAFIDRTQAPVAHRIIYESSQQKFKRFTSRST